MKFEGFPLTICLFPSRRCASRRRYDMLQLRYIRRAGIGFSRAIFSKTLQVSLKTGVVPHDCAGKYHSLAMAMMASYSMTPSKRALCSRCRATLGAFTPIRVLLAGHFWDRTDGPHECNHSEVCRRRDYPDVLTCTDIEEVNLKPHH